MQWPSKKKRLEKSCLDPTKNKSWIDKADSMTIHVSHCKLLYVQSPSLPNFFGESEENRELF